MLHLAYLDPGTGSLLLQMLIGASAGLLVFGRYLWSTIVRRTVQPKQEEQDVPKPERPVQPPEN